MLNSIVAGLRHRIGEAIVRNEIPGLGIRRTMRLGRIWNNLRFGKFQKFREKQYHDHFNDLIEENGLPRNLPNTMSDGWALDTSRSLPHLQQLLEDTSKIIEESGEIRRPAYGKVFFQDIMKPKFLEKYPSILDFATSSEVLAAVAEHCGFVPCLSALNPPGVRLMISSNKHEEPNSPPSSSQLFHLDNHDAPLIYVIVALKDIGRDCGPFSYLAASVTRRAADALHYRERRVSHRITDDRMYKTVKPKKLHQLCCTQGTVLFINTSDCFHYGSRNAVKPRYQLMYAYVSACRTDCSEQPMRKSIRSNQVGNGDSRLRRLVLDKKYRF